MARSLGGTIGANKARDRLGTKNSNISSDGSRNYCKGDFYEDDTDSMTNKLKDKQLNVLGIMRKLGGKTDENCSLEELLFDLGMSEDQFLLFGEIWRKYGGRDDAASLRQRDQFIFLKDLPALVCEVGKSCFGIKESASERFVSRLDLPVMGFYYGYTGLDETGQFDEQLMVQQAPTPSFFQQICLKLRGAPACAYSEDEESDAESTAGDEDEVDSDLILKVHRLDVTMFLLKEKKSFKDMNERDQRSMERSLHERLSLRWPTRELLDSYVTYNVRSLPEALQASIFPRMKMTSFGK